VAHFGSGALQAGDLDALHLVVLEELPPAKGLALISGLVERRAGLNSVPSFFSSTLARAKQELAARDRCAAGLAGGAGWWGWLVWRIQLLAISWGGVGRKQLAAPAPAPRHRLQSLACTLPVAAPGTSIKIRPPLPPTPTPTLQHPSCRRRGGREGRGGRDGKRGPRSRGPGAGRDGEGGAQGEDAAPAAEAST
jgi:hypothetical protein